MNNGIGEDSIERTETTEITVEGNEEERTRATKKTRKPVTK
jgi:hypothetical protein